MINDRREPVWFDEPVTLTRGPYMNDKEFNQRVVDSTRCWMEEQRQQRRVAYDQESKPKGKT